MLVVLNPGRALRSPNNFDISRFKDSSSIAIVAYINEI